jgi:hypothetical protein
MSGFIHRLIERSAEDGRSAALLLPSEQQKRDLAAVLAVQKARTPAQSQRALADATAGTFGFADVLGPKFDSQGLPKETALFDKLWSDAVVAFQAGKGVWNRPRPFVVSTEVQPLGDKTEGSSYPSGASTVNYLTAIILANMVPEKSAALYARADANSAMTGSSLACISRATSKLGASPRQVLPSRSCRTPPS